MSAPSIVRLPGGDLQVTSDRYVANYCRYDDGYAEVIVSEFAPEYGPDGPQNAGGWVLDLHTNRGDLDPADFTRGILALLESDPEALGRMLDQAQVYLAEGETELASDCIARAQALVAS